MLKRLIPLYKTSGGPAAEVAELRRRLNEAHLDASTIAYLTETTEAELDFARLRLT